MEEVQIILALIVLHHIWNGFTETALEMTCALASQVQNRPERSASPVDERAVRGKSRGTVGTQLQRFLNVVRNL